MKLPNEQDTGNRNIYYNDRTILKTAAAGGDDDGDLEVNPYKNGCLDVYLSKYHVSIHRQQLFNWALIIAQASKTLDQWLSAVFIIY